MKKLLILCSIAYFLLTGCSDPDEIADSAGIPHRATPVSVLTAYPARYRKEPTESAARVIREFESITRVRCDVLTVDDIKTSDVALLPKEVIDILVWSLIADEERKKYFGEGVAANFDGTDIVFVPRLDEIALWYVLGGRPSVIENNIRETLKLSPVLENAVSLNADEHLLSDIINFAPRLYHSFPPAYWDALTVDGILRTVPSRAPTRDELIWIIRKDIQAETGISEVRDYLDLARYWLRAKENHPEYLVLTDLATPWLMSLQWLLERALQSRYSIRFYDPIAEERRLSCFYMTDNNGKLFSLLEHPRSEILDSIHTFSRTAVVGIFEPSGRVLTRKPTINLLAEFDKQNPRWYSLAISIEPVLYTILDSERRDTYYQFAERILEGDEYTIFVPWKNTSEPIIEPTRYPSFVFRKDTPRDRRIAILAAMNQMFSDESHDIYAYGLENHDWIRTNDNSVETIPGSSSGSEVSDYYFPIAQLPYPASYGRKRAVTPTMLHHYVEDYREYFGNYKVDILSGFKFNEWEISAEMAIYRNEIVPSLNQFVTGTKSISEDWDSFTTTYRPIVAVIREEIQKQIDEYLLRR